MQNKLLIAGSCALFMQAGLSLTAKADTTWLPDFNPAQKVYVDPKLANQITLSPQFQSELTRRSRENNLTTYVVITQQGDELLASDRNNWAADMLHYGVWDKLLLTSGFVENRSLVVLYIRSKDARDSNAGSTAVRVGSFLHQK